MIICFQAGSNSPHIFLQGNNGKTGLQLLEGIAEELDHPEPQVVIDGGHEIMRDMHSKDILIGVTSLDGYP